MNSIENNQIRFTFSIDESRSEMSEYPSSIAESNETVTSPVSASTVDFAADNQARSLAEKIKRFFCCK